MMDLVWLWVIWSIIDKDYDLDFHTYVAFGSVRNVKYAKLLQRFGLEVWFLSRKDKEEFHFHLADRNLKFWGQYEREITSRWCIAK